MNLILGSSIEVVGAREIEQLENGWVTFHRLPAWTKAQQPFDDIARWANMPSGVRLRFKTASDSIFVTIHAYRLTIAELVEEKGLAQFDLLVDGKIVQTKSVEKGGEIRLTMDGPKVTQQEWIRGEEEIIEFSGLGSEMKEIEIWLPPSAIISIGSLDANGEILAPDKDSSKVWAHYGSSISHCLEAERPMNIWGVYASRLLGLNFQNFALAGEAHVDGFVARSMIAIKPDYISLKLGINVVNADSMRERAFVPAVHNFLDIIRESLPVVPILLISPIICPFHEVNPGPTLIGPTGLYSVPRAHILHFGALNLPRIRTLLEEIVDRRKDTNLHFLSGLQLFNEDDVTMMPDQLHPNAEGYRLMGERFTKLSVNFFR
jgi:lysophospholipase L1-like esterase